MRQHRHHLIPKHMGGDNSEENLTPPISIQLHAEFHRLLYEDFGSVNDKIAWKALSGRITGEEARLEAALEGQRKSEKYKNRAMKDHLDKVRTPEGCRKGGLKASKNLVQWIKDNKEEHSKVCAKNGRTNGERLHKPHEYLGVYYESKKSLQEEYKMSNTKFYSLLEKGVIKRLIKEMEGE